MIEYFLSDVNTVKLYKWALLLEVLTDIVLDKQTAMSYAQKENRTVM